MNKFISLGARAFPSLIAAATMLGCYAEPYCAVNGIVEGNFSGQIAWRGAGESDCALGLDGELVLGTGAERILIAHEDYFGPPMTTIGQYTDLRVSFQSGGNEWNGEDCQVSIVSVIREDWTKSDYLYVTGALVCPTLTSAEAAPINLAGVGFTGYFIESTF